MTRKLTDKERRFIEEYPVDLNATQAAIRAGYSKDSARQLGSDTLAKPYIAEAIAESQAALALKAGITVEMIVAELAKIGFSSMGHYMRVGPDGDPYLDFTSVTESQKAAVSELTVEDFKDGRGEDARDVRRIKFKLHDKAGALVNLGKHLGMFPTRLTGPNGGPIQVESVRPSSRELAKQMLAIIRESQEEGSSN